MTTARSVVTNVLPFQMQLEILDLRVTVAWIHSIPMQGTETVWLSAQKKQLDVQKCIGKVSILTTLFHSALSFAGLLTIQTFVGIFKALLAILCS